MKDLSFDYLTIPNNVAAIHQCYEQNGIVCIQQFLDQSLLNQLKADLSVIEEDAIFDLKKNWQNKKVCFFFKECAKRGNDKK